MPAAAAAVVLLVLVALAGQRMLAPARSSPEAMVTDAVTEIVPTVKFYDYEAKYSPGASKHILPAPILPFVYQEVRRLTLAAHNALGCRGVSRADFRSTTASKGWVRIEVGTQPA